MKKMMLALICLIAPTAAFAAETCAAPVVCVIDGGYVGNSDGTLCPYSFVIKLKTTEQGSVGVVSLPVSNTKKGCEANKTSEDYVKGLKFIQEAAQNLKRDGVCLSIVDNMEQTSN